MFGSYQNMSNIRVIKNLIFKHCLVDLQNSLAKMPFNIAIKVPLLVDWESLKFDIMKSKYIKQKNLIYIHSLYGLYSILV